MHASYYFEKLLVEKNVYLKEGTNIIQYTNGAYLIAPYDCVLISSNLPNEDEICTAATNEKIEGRITSISEVGTYSSSGSYFSSIVTFENYICNSFFIIFYICS